MEADDFQNLYKMVRGTRSAMVVLDAGTLHSEGKMIEAHEKLAEARELFLDGRMRLITQDVEQQIDPKSKPKDADKQLVKLKRKQEKLRNAKKAFDELMAGLEKAADRQRQKLEKQAAAEAEARRAEVEKTLARQEQITKDFRYAFKSASGEESLDLIGGEFGFQPVMSEADIHADALYFIHTGGQSLIVRTPAREKLAATLSVVSAVDDRRIKPFTREAFLKLGKSRKMVLLTSAQTTDETDREESPSEVNDQPAPSPEDQNVLDMGAFGQLLSAAQRSGLVSGADQIAHVRDKEFRMGDYDRAFQTIDSLYARFLASSSQRTQQLSREEADISSGRVKISPKDLLAKRARDQRQTQEIERANRRFQVVLEGLRILMNA